LIVPLVLVLVLVAGVLVACGGGGDDAPTATAPSTGEVPAQATPSPENGATPTATTAEAPTPVVVPTVTVGEQISAPLTPEQLAAHQPNELGWIPLLEYHHFGPEPDQFTRTPEQFRADLQWLYDHNFYVVNLHDYIDDNLDVPLGKHPVMLSFDDSAVSQFRLTPLDNGQMAVDPNSAVAILEQFFAEHPDFGRGGHFAVLPKQETLFAWPDGGDQVGYGQMKLEWLLQNGYEIGNHTVDHANLSEISNEEIMAQLAGANIMIAELVPQAQVRVVTLPYGSYPNGGDDTVFKGFDYQGQHFVYEGVLLVGANPAYSLYSTEYDPYAIPRMQAFDDELNNNWFPFIEENPGVLYTSDGNPNTVTVPLELHWALVDTLDETSIGDRELIRY
jgi:peptidoglycan/xylan/chitin deacetylase (PgdA/CDA1 family)